MVKTMEICQWTRLNPIWSEREREEAKDELAKKKSSGYGYGNRNRGRDRYRSGARRDYRRHSRDRKTDRYVEDEETRE